MYTKVIRIQFYSTFISYIIFRNPKWGFKGTDLVTQVVRHPSESFIKRSDLKVIDGRVTGYASARLISEKLV